MLGFGSKSYRFTISKLYDRFVPPVVARWTQVSTNRKLPINSQKLDCDRLNMSANLRFNKGGRTTETAEIRVPEYITWEYSGGLDGSARRRWFASFVRKYVRSYLPNQTGICVYIYILYHDLRFWHQMRDLNSALKRRHNTRRQKCNARVCWRNFATQVFNGPMDIYLFLVQIHNTLCSSQILVWINMIYVLFIEVISILIGK